MTDRTTGDRPFGAGSPASQQVAWWPVHEFITELVAHTANVPAAGTPAWCALDDTDPAKLVALAAAGEYHVLRIETAQEHLAEASKSIAAAENWTALAQRIQNGRGTAYIPRRKTA